MTWKDAMDSVPMLALLVMFGQMGWIMLAVIGEFGWPFIIIPIPLTALSVALGWLVVKEMVEDWRR